ncbi:MAG: LPXTG cell wall anchor domain-containing protein [Lachnospiraceae bacterium]|nr:LPXTG cell wall anchor domain-containing protein [Lachnospiraceae bacterium]
MKRMRKLVSLLLTLVMVIAMAVPAFAKDEEVKLTNPMDGHTYTAYQIFKGEISGAEDNYKLANLQWGDNVNSETLLAALKAMLNSEFTDATDAVAVAEVIAERYKEAAALDQLAKIITEHITGDGTVLTKEDGNDYASASVAPGYYMIQDTVAENGNQHSISKYIVEVVGPTDLVQKSKETTVEKKIQKITEIKDNVTGEVTTNKDGVDLDEAGIGEPKEFTLTATLPEDYALYKSFYLNFRDTMQHMEFIGVDSVVVMRGDREIAAIAATDSEDKATDKYFVSYSHDETEDTGSLSVLIKNLKKVSRDIQAGDKVIVTYQAKLTPQAVIAGDTNINKVVLDYSNNPNSNWDPDEENPEEPNPPYGTTPEDEVELVTTELVIQKTDGEGKNLAGAGFTLTGDVNDIRITTTARFTRDDVKGIYYELTDGTYTTTSPDTTNIDTDKYVKATDGSYPKYKLEYVQDTEEVKSNTETTKVIAWVDESGQLVFSGLGAGNYTLTESTTPVGYNTIEPINFTIKYIPRDTPTEELEEGQSVGFYVSESNYPITLGTEKNNLMTTVVNNSGAVLPSTGGIGTTIFYVLGSILLIGAGVLLVTKRKMAGRQ